MTEASGRYIAGMHEAVKLNEQKNGWGTAIVREIKAPQNKKNPNQGITAVGRTFVFTGSKLSGQIIDAVRIGHIQIAIVGLRALFELMVNTKYIYAHPKQKRSIRHMRRVAKDVMRLTNKKRPTNHAKLDGKRLIDRMREIDLLYLYKTLYRELSEWSHIGLRTPYLSNQVQGEQYGLNVTSVSLCCAHDTLEAACEGLSIGKNPELKQKIIDFRDKYQKSL